MAVVYPNLCYYIKEVFYKGTTNIEHVGLYG